MIRWIAYSGTRLTPYIFFQTQTTGQMKAWKTSNCIGIIGGR